MDQRTRERLPVSPVLVCAVNDERRAAAARPAAAQAAAPGETFAAAGQTVRRSVMSSGSVRIWADDLGSGQRRDLTLEEHRGFWAWAVVEVLRHTGIRIEELSELSHHSLIQYRLPGTGELIPLLQIAPSKTDTERLLVVGPELADVLSAIICRIRTDDGAVPWSFPGTTTNTCGIRPCRFSSSGTCAPKTGRSPLRPSGSSST
jgi:hypothetical protein